MNNIRIAVVASLALLAGCAGQRVTLSDDHRGTLTEQTVHAVHLQPLGFRMESTGYTVAGVLFTPLVAVAAAAEGESIRSSLPIEDPVVRVKERVLSELEEHYKLPKLKRVAAPAPRLLDTQYKSLEGVLFEVRTTQWGLDNNRAKYAAGIRVLRLSDGVTLWDAVCSTVTADKDKPAPSLDALRADQGVLLQAKLNQAADACADQLAGWAIKRAENR